MRSPFPGMDPYLENPERWPHVHNALIAELLRVLGPLLRPHYVIQIEERTYADAEGGLAIGIPDLAVHRSPSRRSAKRRLPRGARSRSAGAAILEVSIPMPEHVRETWLQVRAVPSGDVVTVVEVLSPGNKRPGEGRRIYEEKRQRVLGTRTHLVEIDLLRAGEPMPILGGPAGTQYSILVSRSELRPQAQLVAFSVRDAIPTFLLPLSGDCPEPEVALRPLLDDIYATSSLDLVIDYRNDPVPTLPAGDASWARRLLRARRPRG